MIGKTKTVSKILELEAVVWLHQDLIGIDIYFLGFFVELWWLALIDLSTEIQMMENLP